MINDNVIFKKYIGKSGKTWLVGIKKNWKSHIYVSATKEENGPGYEGSRGFGGNTLQFKLEDGNTLFLTGPWHSNPNSFFEDTSIREPIK